MRRFTWLVFSNCEVGYEAEFADWYDRTHLSDLLRIPGLVAARRLELADVQTVREDSGVAICDAKRNGARFRILAIYEIEADEPGAVFAELIRRSGTPEMPVSPHLREVYTVLYQASGCSP